MIKKLSIETALCPDRSIGPMRALETTTRDGSIE